MALFTQSSRGLGVQGQRPWGVQRRATPHGQRQARCKKTELKPTYISINICNCHDFPLALPYNAKASHLPSPARHFHVSIFSQRQSLPSSPAPNAINEKGFSLLGKRVIPLSAKGSHPLEQKGRTPLGKRAAPL